MLWSKMLMLRWIHSKISSGGCYSWSVDCWCVIMINLCLILKAILVGRRVGMLGVFTLTDWLVWYYISRTRLPVAVVLLSILSILLSHSIIIYYLQIYNEDGWWSQVSGLLGAGGRGLNNNQCWTQIFLRCSLVFMGERGRRRYSQYWSVSN